MALGRYSQAPIIDFGNQYGTSGAVSLIRSAIASGNVSIVDQITLKGAERLDTMAGSIYGDARYWWVLAAASNIGWGMQVPPGTIINVPSLTDISKLVG